MKCYAGLDVSLKETAICVIDEEGTIIREGSVSSEPEDIAAWLSANGGSIEKIGLEIGGISRWLHIELMKLGLPSICIDPRRLRGLTKTMPVKSDRNDARAIARVMRAGWYTQVHIKSEQSQKLKMLLTNRKILLTKVIDIENAIRGTLRAFGLRLAGRIATPQFERRARELVEDHPDLALMIEPMLAARAVLREQWARLDRMTLQVAKVDPVCRLLMTAPGVGALTAVTFVTTIDDPGRFRRSRDVGAHLGLTPRKYASGEVDRNGAISKHGDPALRSVLYQAALALLTRSQRWSSLRAWGMNVARRCGLRRAVVATARKLAVVMHRMWTDGAEFRWSRTTAEV